MQVIFFESEIKLSYISSSGVCGRSREDAFGAKQHDFLWRLIEESNPLLWRYYSYFRFFFFFGNYSFFFLYKNCRQFFFFKHFNGFEFWFKFRSYFFRTGISLLGVWVFFPAILKRKKTLFKRYSFFETVWWHDFAIPR